MKLLIDYGNTRLKWATLEGDRLAPARALGRDEPIAVLNDLWSTLAKPESVTVSSVVAAAREAELAALIHQRFGLDSEFVRSPKRGLGVTSAYEHPAHLGVDRFLAMAALHRARPGAQVIVSVGTALTVDALTAEGRHLGGLIAPSPELMRRAVLGAAARIGGAEGAVVEIADDTADAVHSGCVLSAVALVERFRAQAGQRMGTQPALILTGGGAEEIAPLLPDAVREPDLVLRGLRAWAETEPASR